MILANFARELQSSMVGRTCPQVGEASWPMWESGLSHDTHSQEAGNEQEEEWGYKVSRSSSDLLSLARLPAYEGSTTSGTASPAGNKWSHT